MNATTLTENQITDIAINIVDDLVLKGYVQDCIDTEDETEFEVQDIIVEHLKKSLTVS
jgi:hypothetical protein